MLTNYVLILANTGIRVGEARDLKWSNIDTFIGEDLQQHRMWDGPVDDVRTADATGHRLQRAADFRQHAPLDHAGRDQAIDLGAVEAGEDAACGVHQARHIRQQHQFFHDST